MTQYTEGAGLYECTVTFGLNFAQRSGRDLGQGTSVVNDSSDNFSTDNAGRTTDGIHK